MKLEVKSLIHTLKTTISELYVDGRFQCHILEDVTRKTTDKKVYGATAIPCGTYKVIIDMSNRFKRLLPLLVDVPGFVGVRIHPGNKAADTEGCLLPGTYDPSVKDWVSNSRAEFDKLFKRMQANTKKGEAITITIDR
ncbi:DUF5675 family protein [Hymenobacter monticola]